MYDYILQKIIYIWLFIFILGHVDVCKQKESLVNTLLSDQKSHTPYQSQCGAHPCSNFLQDMFMFWTSEL